MVMSMRQLYLPFLLLFMQQSIAHAVVIAGEKVCASSGYEEPVFRQVQSVLPALQRTGTSVHMSTPVKQTPAVQRKMPRPAAKVRNDKVRSKTRVNIGIAFKKWRKLRSEKAMKSDAELALYLLDSNEKHRQVFPTLLFPHAPPSDEDPPPLYQEQQLPVDTERMTGAPETLERLKRKEQLSVENPSPAAAPEVPEQQQRVTTEDETEGSSGSWHSADDSCYSPQRGTTPDDSDDSEYSEHTTPRKDKPEVISSEDRDQEFLGKRLMYNCQDCGRTFRANQTLTAHRNIYHLPPDQPEEPPDQPKPPKTYKCTTCSKVFQTSGGLSRHRIIHSGIKPFKCTFCGRGFTQVGNLKTHQKVHRGEKPTDAAPQKQCSSTTEGGEQPSGESHFCRVCWTQFSDKGLLEEHAKRSHGSNRRLPCTECRWTFANAEKLQQHQAMHKAPKPHQCSQCNKGYRTAVALKDHMRDHTGEKPFVCNICGRRFKRESSIKSHYAAHSRARPHLCFVCGKSYGRAEQLKVHMRVHTGERPYQCNDCDRSFYYKEGLLSHVKVHIAKPIGPTRKRGRPAFSRRT